MDATLSNDLVKVSRQPERFIQKSVALQQALKSVLTRLFDTTKHEEVQSVTGQSFGSLPKLYVDGFDAEQIWEELQLRAVPFLEHAEDESRQLIAAPHKVSLIPRLNKTPAGHRNDVATDIGSSNDATPVEHRHASRSSDGGSSDDDDDDDDDNDDDSSSSDGEAFGPAADAQDATTTTDTSSGGAASSQMDILAQMEAFAEQEERKEYGDDAADGATDDEDDDWQSALFAGASAAESQTAERLRYNDVFAPESDATAAAAGDSPRANDGGAGDDSAPDHPSPAGSNDPVSDFHKGQLRLQRQIATLEEAAIAEKAWSLVGEARASDRPENSLLGLHVDYETASAPAPVITHEVTSTIEDIVKRRIKNESWDDVIRTMPDDGTTDSQLADVSQEKSAAGLGELYEAEYLKRTLGLQDDEKQKKQQATQRLFDKLCDRLNALSNFHFTPKSASIDLEVAPSLPSLAMEEVIPLAVSTADLQAPGEVYKKKSGRAASLQGAMEMSREDKTRRRRAQKAAKRKRRRQREAEQKLVQRVNPGLGNRYSKQQLAQDIRNARNVTVGKNAGNTRTNFSKSGKFFDKLQATIADDVRNAAAGDAGRSSVKRSKGSSHKL